MCGLKMSGRRPSYPTSEEVPLPQMHARHSSLDATAQSPAATPRQHSRLAEGRPGLPHESPADVGRVVVPRPVALPALHVAGEEGHAVGGQGGDVPTSAKRRPRKRRTRAAPLRHPRLNTRRPNPSSAIKQIDTGQSCWGPGHANSSMAGNEGGQRSRDVALGSQL